MARKLEKVKHGTFYAYNIRKCRCPRCTRANTDKARAYRDKKRAELVLASPAPMTTSDIGS